MRLKCISGYYRFEKEDSLDVVKMKDLFGVDLVACEDHYTFAPLRDMKEYSVLGYPIGATVAISTTVGKKWEVLKRNLAVYNILLGQITTIALSVRSYTVPADNGRYLGFTSIPQAGGLINGQPFISYNAHIDLKTGLIRVGDIGTW